MKDLFGFLVLILGLAISAEAGGKKPLPAIPTSVMGHLISVTTGAAIEPEYNTTVYLTNVGHVGANNAGHYQFNFKLAQVQHVQVCATAFSYVKSCAYGTITPGRSNPIDIQMHDDVSITRSVYPPFNGPNGAYDSNGVTYHKLPRGEYVSSKRIKYFPLGGGYYYDSDGYVYSPLFSTPPYGLLSFVTDGSDFTVNVLHFHPANNNYTDLYDVVYMPY